MTHSSRTGWTIMNGTWNHLRKVWGPTPDTLEKIQSLEETNVFSPTRHLLLTIKHIRDTSFWPSNDCDKLIGYMSYPQDLNMVYLYCGFAVIPLTVTREHEVWFTLSIVYYWMQNAIRFLWENIRNWCVLCVCLEHDSELGVTQELVLQSRVLHKSDISGTSYVTCPGTYPSSRIPSSHWILSWLRPHLIVLPFTLPSVTSPVQCQESSFMDTITFLDSGEWQ
jgi:hypothetical protein